MNLKSHRIFSLALAIAGLLGAASPAATQTEPRRILVTVAEVLAEPLTAVELDLRISKKPAEVTRVYQPQERPVQLALLIDDSIPNSLPDLPGFLRSLPAGSEVMLAYVRGGSLQVAQTFTPDLEKAAGRLRAPSGSSFMTPPSLGQTILDALAHFPAGGTLRRQILYIGEGRVGQDPYNDVPLNRAIASAQTRGIPVWVIRIRTAGVARLRGYTGSASGERLGASLLPTQRAPVRNRETPPRQVPAPSPQTPEPTGLALKRLSQETGGEAFALGVLPPTLAPYLDELRGLLDRQYLVEFTPPRDKSGQVVAGKLTVQVRGRKEVGLLYPQR